MKLLTYKIMGKFLNLLLKLDFLDIDLEEVEKFTPSKNSDKFSAKSLCNLTQITDCKSILEIN